MPANYRVLEEGVYLVFVFSEFFAFDVSDPDSRSLAGSRADTLDDGYTAVAGSWAFVTDDTEGPVAIQLWEEDYPTTDFRFVF